MAKMSKLNDTNTKKNKDNIKNKNANKSSHNDGNFNDESRDLNKNISEENNDKLSDENEVNEDLNQEEMEKIKDQLLRTLAENENLRKRTDKDIEQIKKYGHISFVRDLLSSVDNLSRAVNAAPLDKENLDEPLKNLVVGVEIVLSEINSFLEKNKITKIDPLGEKFDYNVHQAMYEEPSEKYEAGIVTEVIQIGYLLHDRLVRPALVGISKKKTKNEN